MGVKQSRGMCPPRELDHVCKIVCEKVNVVGRIHLLRSGKQASRARARSGLAALNLTLTVLSSKSFILYALKNWKHVWRTKGCDVGSIELAEASVVVWAAGSKRLRRLGRSSLATLNLAQIILSSGSLILYARKSQKCVEEPRSTCEAWNSWGRARSSSSEDLAEL